MTSTAASPAVSLTLYLSVNGPIMLVSKSAIFDVISPVKSPSIESLAVAPASIYGISISTNTELLPFNVITGGSSTTLTVLVTVFALLPCVLVILYVTMCVPTVLVSRGRPLILLGPITRSPSILSLAVAPASTLMSYVEPFSTVTVDKPFKCMAGIYGSRTITVLVTSFDVSPTLLVTLYVT